MKYLKVIFIIFVAVSCSDNEDEIFKNNLSFYLNNKTTEEGAVISCAGSDAITGDVLVFYYPENKVVDIRFYETSNTEEDKKDYSLYKRVDIIGEPFFNGYMGAFRKTFPRENWVIITYELDNEIKLSNPIRIRNLTKPTVWTDDVNIDQNQTMMPIFTWLHNASGDNAIYFQVVSDFKNNLLSGTYTFENYFQYYNTSNVILNITTQLPPDLSIGSVYNFTMMDIGIDNWVNTIIQKPFTAR